MSTPLRRADEERAVVGAMLTQPSIIPDVGATLPPDAFHGQRRAIFVQLCERYEEADGHVDLTALAGDAATAEELSTILGMTSWSTSMWRRHAKVLLDAMRHEQRFMDAQKMLDAMANGGDVDEAVAAFVERAEADDVSDLEWEYLDEFVQREHPEGGWLIPGLMRRDWKALIVGDAGVGKMVLLRQIAILAACGRDPFMPTSEAWRFDPIRVLMLDAENSAQTIRDQSMMLGFDWEADAAGRIVIVNDVRLDLNNPRHRRNVEAMVRHHKPDLIVAGPVYKLGRRSASNNDWEVHAQGFISFFDTLMAKYQCAVMLEGHVPAGSSKSSPYGSSLLTWWPEVGLALMKTSETERKLERFRTPRSKTTWPDKIVQYDGRRVAAPWMGIYESGRSLPGA